MRFSVGLILVSCLSFLAISGCEEGGSSSRLSESSATAPSSVSAIDPDSPLWISRSRKANAELLEVLDDIDALYDPSAHEFLIYHDGMVFYISCPVKKESLDAYASIMLFHEGYAEIKDFAISVGDKSYLGPHHAGDGSGAKEFIEIINGIRGNDVELAFDGRLLKLPQSNVSGVIPPVSAKSFPCKGIQGKAVLQ